MRIVLHHDGLFVQLRRDLVFAFLGAVCRGDLELPIYDVEDSSILRKLVPPQIL